MGMLDWLFFFLLSGSGHEWLNAFDIISICSCAMYPVLLWEQIDSCGSKDVRARSLVWKDMTSLICCERKTLGMVGRFDT
jgi:hypothetical protein